MPNSQVSFSFNVDLSKLQNDREKYIARIEKIKKQIDIKLARLQHETHEEASPALKTLQDLAEGLENAKKSTLTALDGLEAYAKSGKTIIEANLDDERNCTGYPNQDIQQFFTHIIQAVNILRDCGAFTMSPKLVSMQGMALWSKLHQDKATQLAEEMHLTTLEGSLGGSLFDQLPWGTKWQSIQGDPLHTQWKALSMIAANMAIKNKIAHVLLLMAPHPVSMFTKEELPHLIAHGITIEPDKGLESIQVHLYALAEDRRKRPIDIIFKHELNLDKENTQADSYIISPSNNELADIYFYKKGEVPIQLQLPQTITATKQLTELSQLASQPNNDEKKLQRIKLLAHSILSKIPGHSMIPELVKISEITVPTNEPETFLTAIPKSLEEKKQAFKELVIKKIHLQNEIDESYDVLQQQAYDFQKSKSTFQRIVLNMREKVQNEVLDAYQGKDKPFFERARLVKEALIKTYQKIAQTAGDSLRFYNASTTDRNRIVWQSQSPQKNMQLKHFVLTADPNDANNIQVFYMEGGALKFQVIDKIEIKNLSGLKLEDGKREVCYIQEKAKHLQDRLNLGPVKHEDLQLEASRAAEKYNGF